jgi:Calx-beta domain
MLGLFSRWSKTVLIPIGLAVLSGTAVAQPPIMSMLDVGDFEGNAGTRNLVFTVTLTGPSATPVTATLSAISIFGSTGGASCAGAADFITLNQPFAIPANATTANFSVTICGDTTIEPDEQVFVALTNVVGAQCFEGTCNGVGIIRNDDGPPSISINNISISEPPAGSRGGSFTVRSSHPSQTNTTVNFATRSGTALAASACVPFITGAFPDYLSRSGILTIPANALSVGISVTVCGDNFSEPTQTFFVDLSNPVNATISDGTGQASILNFGFPTVGEWALSPGDARVQVGEKVIFTVGWTVPAGQVWRDLNTIDLRIGRGKNAFWVRWEETGNTFSLCEKVGGNDDDDHDDVDDDDGDDHGSRVRCGTGAAPGSPVVLETSRAILHLAETRVVGSGPTGASVSLEMAISFKQRAAGHSVVELAATNDFGISDDFVQAGTVQVKHSRRH